LGPGSTHEDLARFREESNGNLVDPDKMIVARKTDASAWELHERAYAGEFALRRSPSIHECSSEGFFIRGVAQTAYTATAAHH
jgi:hypothetical protein